MQSAVPELSDIAGETRHTHEMYGLDDPRTEIFGRQCLLARRLVERGVRFVEILPQDLGFDRWDQHSKLQGRTREERLRDRQADRRAA